MKKIPVPPLLSHIPDSPSQLYIRGTLPPLEGKICLAIVGSRKCTEYGKQVCQEIIRGLKGYPFIIISGLAIGIDGIAHQVALEVGIPCIAIPGSGLDPSVLYPKSNRSLAEKIIRCGGCLLSEYEPKFKAARWSFPKRNRIMAGISHAVLVIEAKESSGTSITAQLAVEYGREVFAVPGSVLDENSKGCNSLIQEGAFPVSSAEDIVRYFGLAML